MQVEPMQPPPQPSRTPMWMVVLGWIFTLLSCVPFCLGIGMAFAGAAPGAMPDLGWSGEQMFGIAIVEVILVVLVLFPRTALLGAILSTAYLGGAVATHLRLGDFFVFPIAVSIFMWLGLFLRDQRLRACMPWRAYPDEVRAGGFLPGLLATALLVAVLLGVVAALTEAVPTESRIARVMKMNADRAKIFPYLNDLHKFDTWSPFNKLDPNPKRTYRGQEYGKGAIYDWEGSNGEMKLTMEIVESIPNERVRIKLNFIKPIEAENFAEFTLKADGDKTLVTWAFIGENRDYLHKAKMTFLFSMGIGKSFDEGLGTLKKMVE